MFFSQHNAASAYTNVGLETGVRAASPHKLIIMLYDGALQSLARAREGMLGGQVAQKGEAFSKAIRIIEEGLRASLDAKRGGEIATRLDELYRYMTTRLLTANLRNDAAALDEVSRLLTELRDAWLAIGAGGVDMPAPSIARSAETAETA